MSSSSTRSSERVSPLHDVPSSKDAEHHTVAQIEELRIEERAAILCIMEQSPDGIPVSTSFRHARDPKMIMIRTEQDMDAYLSVPKADERKMRLRYLRDIACKSLGRVLS